MAITAMAKDNFWNRLRVERNIRYRDLADLFGGSVQKWGFYFSGKVLPDINTIKQLCDFFDVDINDGAEEFRKAHAIYEVGTKKRVATNGLSEHTERSASIRVAGEPTQQPEPSGISRTDIFKAVYGKLPYDTFLVFCDMISCDEGDPLECIYGRVSYREYTIIAEALRKGV